MGVCSSGKAEILQANDSLTQVINLYRQLVKGEEMNGETTTPRSLPGVSMCVCSMCLHSPDPPFKEGSPTLKERSPTLKE